ncbi:MAG: hypothetical protein FWE82_05185, partial [Defluviitaleaceae bacterium]|nr:hypothetical protein [Defluviitaleaceae bacterium]
MDFLRKSKLRGRLALLTVTSVAAVIAAAILGMYGSQNITYVAAAIFIIVLFVLSAAIIGSVYKPLLNSFKTLEEMNNGKFAINLVDISNDEMTGINAEIKKLADLLIKITDEKNMI